MRSVKLYAGQAFWLSRGIARRTTLIGLTLLTTAALATACSHRAKQGEGLPTGAPQEGITVTDPDVQANLRSLSMDLHQALIHHSQGFSNFDEFVTYAQEQPPAPPTGTKYAISKACQIVLVQANK